MTYALIPLRNGYYWPCGARNEPTIENDLPYLLSGDSATVERADGGYLLRSQVLIERLSEPLEPSS